MRLMANGLEVFQGLQSSGTTSRKSRNRSRSRTEWCGWCPTVWKYSRGSRAAGQRRVRAETGPDLGLSGAVGVQRSGSLGEAPEQRDNVASESETGPNLGLNSVLCCLMSGGHPDAPEEADFASVCPR